MVKTDQPPAEGTMQTTPAKASPSFAAAKRRVLARLEDDQGREKVADALRRLMQQDRT